MAKWGSALKRMFGGDGRGERITRINNETELGRRQEEQRIAQERQLSLEQNERAERDAEIARARRAPRGRRLLMAATGEDGVKGTIG